MIRLTAVVQLVQDGGHIGVHALSLVLFRDDYAEVIRVIGLEPVLLVIAQADFGGALLDGLHKGFWLTLGPYPAVAPCAQALGEPDLASGLGRGKVLAESLHSSSESFLSTS